MQRPEWCFNFIRPANSPLRRVAALCMLVEKLGTGWLRLFHGLIEGADGRKAAAQIERSLVIKDDGYWSDHYDLGCRMKKPASVLGAGRAREAAVNSILPFYLAYSWSTGDKELARRIVGMYTGYPALSQNEVTRFMSFQLNFRGRVKGNGCLQQGLLHLFHMYCRTRECERCPVSMRRRPGWG